MRWETSHGQSHITSLPSPAHARGEGLVALARRVRSALGICAVVVTMVLGGCGNTLRHSAARSQHVDASHSARKSEEHLPQVSIEVSLPELIDGTRLPKAYTCMGTNHTPTIRWSNIPRNTKELAMFIISLRPKKGSLVFNWVVLGLRPNQHGIFSRALPRDAIVGRNSFGKAAYTMCPHTQSGKETYIVRLAALPRRLRARSLDAHTLYSEVEKSSTNVGGASFVVASSTR
jgi:hypothetical protein